jgi:DNA end-binding protein Ku
MATQLVDALAADWNPEQYHDTYTEELRKRIKAKGRGKEIEEPEPEERGAEVIDLFEALQNSLVSTRGKTRASRSRKTTKATRSTTKRSSRRSA